jgi:hypothetical protein
MNEYGDLASWTSSVIGQLVYYERSYIYEDAGEVLFVQMRMSEHEESVLWSTDNEGGTRKTHGDGDLCGLEDTRSPASHMIVYPSFSHATIS